MNYKTCEYLNSLAKHYKCTRIDELFKVDGDRFRKFSLSIEGLTLDYSKNLLDDSVMTGLFNLAQEIKLPEFIRQVFDGEKVNFTENRAVLHMALRGGSRLFKNEVLAGLQRINDFADKIRSGTWIGCTGKPIRYVVHIGIGGSHLGPEMVVTALHDYARKDLKAFFVSNVDEKNLQTVLQEVEGEQTLFLIASKTFTTQETLFNANKAKEWLLGRVKDKKLAIQRHFVALSAAKDLAVNFGILPENVFPFEEWVGGRFSLWSSVGLVINLMIGNDKFAELLEGARLMDEHFLGAPLKSNLPVILGLVGFWNINFLDKSSLAVIPYSYHLRKLVSFLQQVDMESNGKSVNREGRLFNYRTSPVIWGGVGTDSQHSFHQALMQGNNQLTVDFIFPVLEDNESQRLLFANCLAQSRALMVGRCQSEILAGLDDSNRLKEVLPHKLIKGNVASNLILMEGLTPKTLGALIALYEHKILVQGVLWDINSFDQWGVELGKKLTKSILPIIQGDFGEECLDSSTLGLIRRRNEILVK